jgi:glutamine amidotransferase
MCRLVAHLGPAIGLDELIVEPGHSLSVQAWDSRQQASGAVNADGFGVGWYDLDVRPEPAVHKSARPVWADTSFASFSGLVRSGAVLSVVRGATAPAPVEDSGAQPFAAEQWLFGHNGAVTGFRQGVASRLRRSLSEQRESALLGASDSEVLFALALDRLDAGASPVDALTAVIAAIDAERGGRLNLVLTDGRGLTATRWGDSLHVRVHDGVATTIASEPFDDDPAWTEVPDRHVVTAVAGQATVLPVTLP